MRRRDFVQAIVCSAAGWPLAVQAQQPAKSVIGLLQIGTASSWDLSGFRQGLRDKGYIEDQNLQIEYRFADDNEARLPELASDLVRRRVLAHPGGNVTGFSDYDPPIAGKWVEFLTQITPPVGRIAVLYNPVSTPFASQILQAVEAAAPRFAVTAQAAPCRDDGDIDSTMAEIARKERGGAIIVPEVFTAVHRDAIVPAAAKHRVPVIYPNRISSTRSELITYGVDPEDLFRDAAVYVDRLLRGANPTDLPVQNPTKFLLTINLTTVKSLGLTIQPNLLATANEVIE